MRLLKKIGIFFRLKWEETFVALFKWIVKSNESIVICILLLLSIFLISYGTGYLVVKYPDNFIIKYTYYILTQDLLESIEDLKNTGIGVYLFHGFFFYCAIIINIMAIVIVGVVGTLIVALGYAFINWLKDNWEEAEYEISSKELEYKLKNNEKIKDYEASLIKSNPKPKTKRPKSYKGNKND